MNKLTNEELLEVAENPETSTEILNKLAKSKYDRVREAVVKSLNAPLEILNKLVKDCSSYIREEVARNKNTSKADLVRLSTDSCVITRCEIAKNENTPKETLIQMLEVEKDKTVIEELKRALELRKKL